MAPRTCFLVLSFGSIAPQISELQGVKNCPFPLTRHIAYITASSYRSSCDICDSCIGAVYFVYIVDKLDEDYLYNWYRTLYRLFSKAGFHLFHTSSHDSLCLQVTLMQSCVYFLSYVRNPGTPAYTMQPPADFGQYSFPTKLMTDEQWRLHDGQWWTQQWWPQTNVVGGVHVSATLQCSWGLTSDSVNMTLLMARQCHGLWQWYFGYEIHLSYRLS